MLGYFPLSMSVTPFYLKEARGPVGRALELGSNLASAIYWLGGLSTPPLPHL